MPSRTKTYILYTGTDTKLSVKMDDEACIFTGVAGGSWQQFKVTPSNPGKGDTNEHTLVISAEDAFGNKGENDPAPRRTRKQRQKTRRGDDRDRHGRRPVSVLRPSPVMSLPVNRRPAQLQKRSGAIRRRSHSERLNEASAGARSATIRSALIST